MGVTIHFEGRLRDRAAMEELLQFARRFAAEHCWVTDEINEVSAKLERVDENEKPYDYFSSVSGLKLMPGDDCELIKLEFDSDLVLMRTPILNRESEGGAYPSRVSSKIVISGRAPRRMGRIVVPIPRLT
jgi:hypothetical protein